jgi:hypothetical protein
MQERAVSERDVYNFINISEWTCRRMEEQREAEKERQRLL